MELLMEYILHHVSSLGSQRLYRASFEKNKGNFKYTSDTPFFQAAKHASALINNVSPLILCPNTVIKKLFSWQKRKY